MFKLKTNDGTHFKTETILKSYNEARAGVDL